MKIPASHWNEASEFLLSLGFASDLLSKELFRKDCEEFLELLLRKNEDVNLTGAKDIETLFWKHLVDSLSILSVSDIGLAVDWGCGGGFPGIPLALVRKHLQDKTPVFFVDSVGKKVKAVEAFCEALQLPNTKGLVGRGEDLIRAGALSDVRTVMMRAVAPAERAWKWIHPEIANWLFLLGPRQSEEWKREAPKLRRLGMEILDERNFALPRGLGQRTLFRLGKSSTWNLQ